MVNKNKEIKYPDNGVIKNKCRIKYLDNSLQNYAEYVQGNKIKDWEYFKKRTTRNCKIKISESKNIIIKVKNSVDKFKTAKLQLREELENSKTIGQKYIFKSMKNTKK